MGKRTGSLDHHDKNDNDDSTGKLALRLLLKLRLSLVALLYQHDGNIVAHRVPATAFDAD
jgi:hypothetical protein